MNKINCSKGQLVLVVSVIVASFVVTTHYLNKYSYKNVEEVRVVSKIDDYSYFLEDNKSRVYTKYFRKLKKVLSNETIDEKEYVSLISKLFIIDFYSLDNKVTNQDVGGLQFVYSEIADNFKLKAENTIYKYIENNIYSNREQELPEVKDAEIKDIQGVNLEYLGNNYQNSYQVNINIIYEKDLGYADSVTLYLIPDNNKYSVIRVIED